MPYYLKVDGIEEVSKMLADMEDAAHAVAAKGLYKGAGIMAESINRNAAAIPTAPFRWANTRKGETRLPSPEEKEIVTGVGAGIARFEGSGAEVNTSVGYQNAGYAVLAGRLKPVPLIVAAINSGTSFMRKSAFFRKAVNSGGKRATAAIKEFIETEYEKMGQK